MSKIEWTISPWMRSTLPHDKVIEWAEATVHVHSDSVLCLENMHEHTEGNAKLERSTSRLSKSPTNTESYWVRRRTKLSSSGMFPGSEQPQVVSITPGVEWENEKSISFMNGVEKWCAKLGSACRMSLVVLKKVFNATLDPTFENSQNFIEYNSIIFPGHTTVEILEEIHIKIATRGTRPEQFEDRIIFLSMFNDID